MRHSISFICLALLISACSNQPHIVKSSNITATSATRIHVVNHGWHTGFVVPADTISSQLPQLKERFKDSPYIEFGWGDQGFYQAEEITSGLTLQAIFWPTTSVVHAVAVPESAASYFPDSHVEPLCLTSEQYARLISFIENSFSKDKDGNIFPTKSGLYGNSQFYKGDGDYYLMNTCNKWTAKGLSSAGMDIITTFKLSADSIMDYLSQYNNSQPYRSGECHP